jgi:hypothetical protein
MIGKRDLIILPVSVEVIGLWAFWTTFMFVVCISRRRADRWCALAVVDCIGICNKEIRQIREMVFAGSVGARLKSVNVFSTHVHSAPDTQGLWGKGLKSGRNKRYMKNLKQSVCDCILESVKAQNR